MSRSMTLLAATAACMAFLAGLGVAGAQQRVSAAEQPSTAATGSTAEPPADDPLRRTTGLPPQQGDGDPGGPGQGRPMLMALVQPDLALVGAFTLGAGPIPWGTSVVLAADDAAFVEDGRCGFRYAYPTRNQGQLAAAAAGNRIVRDQQDGPVLASDVLPPLAVGAQSVASGHVLLGPGTWMLYVHADAAGQVAESDEKNNLRRVRVTVDGACGPARATATGSGS